MKKFIAIILTLMLCAALFGCGGNKAPEGGEQPGTQGTTPAEQTTPEVTTPQATTPEETTQEAASNQQPEDFELVFKSDDTHFVFMQGENMYMIEHEGNTIKGYYGYVDAGDEETAKSAAEETFDEMPEGVKAVYTVGKYVVIAFDENLLKDTSMETIEEVYKDNKVE